jgi:two-component sensor histidine kinase
MQILHVLLNSALRSSRSPEARAVLEDASRRVGAMGAAQQVLYGTMSATSFQADQFLQSVCRTVQQTLGKNVRIKIDQAEGSFTNDAAMPLALILNELMTNAVKHGLKGQDGEIRVGITKEHGSVVAYVEDDGPGFDVEQVQRRSSGLMLVRQLARQLKGSMEVTRRTCTRCAVRLSEQHDVET